MKEDDLNKILNRLYDCYNNKHDDRIFDIISKLLYDFRHKNNVSFFILNKLEELNNKGDSDNVFIQNYLLYDNNIIKSFEISDNVDYYTYYSNIIKRIVLCSNSISQEKEIKLMDIFIKLLQTENFRTPVEEVIIEHLFKNINIDERIIISFLYSDYILQCDKNYDIILNKFSDGQISNIFFNKKFIRYIKGIHKYYDHNTYDILANFIIACSKRNILNINIVDSFNYDIKMELYSKREELSEHTQDILNKRNNRYLNELEYLDGIPNTFREINEIYQKIIWEYLNYEEVKFFTDILEKQNFIYYYYVTYEYFTEEICNMYEEKYKDINKDINKDIVKTGRKEAFEYCKKNGRYSHNNCGYIEPPNLSDEQISDIPE